MSIENIIDREEEEKNVQDLISKLKFISKIHPGCVIDLKSFTVMEQCLSTSLYRTCVRMGAENRDSVLLFFMSTVNMSLDLAEKYIFLNQEYYTRLSFLILNSLEKAKNGIMNYKKTYEDDIMFCSRVETLIETLDIKYMNLNKKYNSISS